MSSYHKTAGDTSLFENAPPMAEVVLEDISKRTRCIIYAEAYRSGATWWHADGRRGRRGLKAEQISDFIVKATRSPRREAVKTLCLDQLRWDLEHTKGEPTKMYHSSRQCLACGEPVADGMIHSCKNKFVTLPHVIPAPVVLAAPEVTPRRDVFVSVFEPQNADNWIRINTAGRIKFSEGLMLRFSGMKVDVAVDARSGRVRVGEAEHGKHLSARGYCFARRIVPLVDFSGGSSVLVHLFDGEDGYLYGDLALAEKAYGADLG
ncbi:hypothetical protein EU642_21835 [Salmonella enterica]|nr:hypothetical protein [Salmonella enterica]EAO0118495.1 hypothetical protein [Salmonella enterica]EAO3601715.1 hypothetical protein [Salmonella enterica]EAR6391612.1 hypothetical protein [Salmonella enterica]EAV1285257.1 hypothetical protein [Salmonella enterica]